MNSKGDLLFSGVFLTALAALMLLFLFSYHRNGGASLIADRARLEAIIRR